MAAKKVSYKKLSPSAGQPGEVKEVLVAYHPASRAIEYLGGRASILSGTRVSEEKDFIPLIKKGIPRKSLDHLMSITGLNAQEMASVMHTSDRTLRRYKPSTLLNPEQSERVIEIARLYSRGEEVFGSIEAFKSWMETSNISLGKRVPKEFLDTSLGIEILMDTIGRIEQGVFG